MDRHCRTLEHQLVALLCNTAETTSAEATFAQASIIQLHLGLRLCATAPAPAQSA
jgi:hypothetical protein